VPVVATAVGGTPEAVADGVDGLLVPPGDPAALAGRILELLADDGRRREMGRLGRDRIRAEFTFEVQAFRFQKVCEALTDGRRAESAATPEPASPLATALSVGRKRSLGFPWQAWSSRTTPSRRPR
jgi:hypothetical protein